MGDLNRDGWSDIVAVWGGGPGTSAATVLLGRGDGTFKTRKDFGTGKQPSAVAIGELTGDGMLDLAVTNRYSSTVSVLVGNGDGTLGNKNDFSTGRYAPNAIAIGDLNGDAHMDLTVANQLSSQASFLLGNG